MSPTGVDISGITTAATLKATTGIVTTLTATTGIVTTLTANTTKITTGIVTTLTATTGIVTTLTTNTLTANSTAKVGSGVTLSPDGDVFTTGVTTCLGTAVLGNTIVGAAVTITASGIEASGIGITCANINGTQIGGRRNLVINGAMMVAQRGTSSTDSDYATVDRFKIYRDGTDEAPTQSKHTLSTSDTPYSSGFRYSYHLTNGNQTSVGADDTIVMQTRIEAQDMATCGWNYTDSNSFITISYWVKSSVSQTFYNLIRVLDGTAQAYDFPIALTADTWKKVTHSIPGNSNITFDNDNGVGFLLEWTLFRGTNDTTSGHTSNAWATYSGTDRLPDMTNTWYDTDDATFELTGVQLEVGSQATPFEHRRFSEELSLCQRYFQVLGGSNGTYDTMSTGACASTTIAYVPHRLVTSMRATPSFTLLGAASDFMYTRDGGDHTPSAIVFDQAGKNMIAVKMTGTSLNQDDATRLFNMNTNGGYLMDAEI